MPFHYNYISRKNNLIENDHNHQVSSEVCNIAKAHSHTQKQCTNINEEEEGNVTDNTESNACNEFYRTLLFTMINLSSGYAAKIREMATEYSGKGKEMNLNHKCSEHNNSVSSIDAHSDYSKFCQVSCHAKLESICQTQNCDVSHHKKNESLEIFVCGKYHPPVGTSARSIEVYEVYTLSHEVITTIPEISVLLSQMCTIHNICNSGKEEIGNNCEENVSVNEIEPKKELLYCETIISEKLLELLHKNYVCRRTLCRVIEPVEKITINTTDITTATTSGRVNNIALINYSNSTNIDCNNNKYYYNNYVDDNTNSYRELEKEMLIKVIDNDEKMCEMCHAECVASPMEECMNSSEFSEESNGPTSDDHSVDCTFASIQESTDIIVNNDNNNNANFSNSGMQQRHNASRVASLMESSSSSSSSSLFVLAPSALELLEMSEVTFHSPFSITESNSGLSNAAHKNKMEKYNKNKNYSNKNIHDKYHSLCSSQTKQSDYYKPTIPSSCTVEELLFCNSTAHTRCKAMAMSSLITNNKFYNHRVPIGWNRWAELCEELDRAFVVNLMDEIVHYCHCTRAAFYTAVGLLDHFVGVNHDPQYTTHKFTEELAHRATQCHFVKKCGAIANSNIHRSYVKVMREQGHHIAPTEFVVDVSHMQDNYCNQVSHANPHYTAHTSTFYSPSLPESSTTLFPEVAAHQEAEMNAAKRKEEEEKWEEFPHHNEVRESEIHSAGAKTSSSPPPLPSSSSESIRAFFTQVIAVCCMLGCKFTDTYPPHVSKIMLCLRAENCFTPDAFSALELFVLKTLSYKTQSTTVNEVVDTLLDLIAPHFSPTAANNEVSLAMVVHDSELHYSELAHRWATSVEEEVYRLKQIHEWFTYSDYYSSPTSELSTYNYELSANTMVRYRQEQQQQYFVVKQWNMFAFIARYLCDEVIRGKRITLPLLKNNICSKKYYEQNTKEYLRLSSEHEMNEVYMPFLSSSPCELGIAIIRAAAYFANYSLPPVLQKIDNTSCTFASFCVEHIRHFHNYKINYDKVHNSQKECINAHNTHAAKKDMSYGLDNAAERQALLLYFAWLTATADCHEVESCVHDIQNAYTSPCSREKRVSERIDKLERGIYDCFRDAQVKGIDSILRKRYELLVNMFKQN